ncbi:MAG: efflux RND transporter periplasmic adaptor subunit [Terriglobales bacterium]
MKLSRHKWLILLAILVVIGIFAAFTLTRKEKREYFTGKAEHGDIRDVVEATGTINAVTSVQVGSQVSGTISKLYVDFNSQVKKGQLIAQIDPSLFEGTLLQAKADLANANANYVAAKANLEKAKATAEQTRADYVRTAGLAKEGVMSQQQLDLAKANAETAEAAVSAAAAQVKQAAAQVKQKEAAVKVAQTNLNYTHIYAPIDGVVVNRAVDVGQTVAASLQAPTLFTIAQDLTKMQVYAKTDEADVGQIRPGQRVTFKVDAFPKDQFDGVVMQVRMNPTTVQNVVTYDTIVNFDNPELKLFPGMTAYIEIPVASVHDVLKVPNGALRYKPDLKPEELAAIYKKYRFEQAEAQKTGKDDGRGAETNGRQWRAAGADQQRGAGADQSSARHKPPDIATVWKLHADKTLEPVRIRTGLTDHTVTEVTQVIKGDLKEGDELVIGSASLVAPSGPGAAPGMGGPRGPRR